MLTGLLTNIIFAKVLLLYKFIEVPLITRYIAQILFAAFFSFTSRSVV